MRIASPWNARNTNLFFSCRIFPRSCMDLPGAGALRSLSDFSVFLSTFADTKIYLYWTDSKNFGCFEKLCVWIVHFCGLRRSEWDFGTPLVRILRADFGASFLAGFWQVLVHLWSIYPSGGYPMCRPITKNTGNRRLISPSPSPENLKLFHQETKKLCPKTKRGERVPPPPRLRMSVYRRFKT